MTQVWDIVAADDLSKIGDAAKFLQSLCPPETDTVWSEDYFRWKLGKQNPAGSGFMTVAICEDKIVGVTTITKKRLWINGELVIGGEIGDTYTHPDFLRQGQPTVLYKSTSDPEAYLNKSIFGRLVTETITRAESAGVSIIYGTPNANSMPGYIKRLNFIEHKCYSNRNLIRPTPQGLVSKISLFKYLTFALNPIDQFISKIIAWGSNCNVTLRKYEKNDVAIDRLWQISNKKNGFSIIKDHDWYSYRFMENPIGNYTMLAIYHHNSFVGIIVARVFKTMNGRSFNYIADWQIKDNDPKILKAAISQIVSRNTNRDIDGTVTWIEDKSIDSKVLRKIGFKASGHSPIIFWNSPAFQSIQKKIINFDFSLACSDNV